MLIATKAGPDARAAAAAATAPAGTCCASLDASLRRLGTDYVDLWQVHGYDPQTPLEETLAALDHAVTSGRVRYVGVSNFAGWQTARAAAWQSAFPGRAPIVAAQVEYSLLERGIEREVLPAAAALGIGVLPWSPLGRGVLTGKYRNGRPARLAGRVRAPGRVRPAVPGAAQLEHRRGGRHRGRRPGRVAARGGAGLGAGPARAWPRRSSAPAPPGSCRARCSARS